MAGGCSAVGQEILDNVVAVGLEQNASSAILQDLLRRALDHAMALAGHGGFDLAGAGDLEALLGARLGLDLGHFDLLRFGSDAEKVRSCRMLSSERAE